MLKANKLVVLATGLSAEIESTISVTQVHGFRQVRLHTPRERGRDKLIPTKKQNSSGAADQTYANRSSSSDKKKKSYVKNISSFTGNEAAGWIIKFLGEDGPTLYHTGDTKDYKDIQLVDQLYKPTHILIPIGEMTLSTPKAAAAACKTHLKNCHTLIPMLLRSTQFIGGEIYDTYEIPR